MSNWNDNQLDKFERRVDERFDKVDERFSKVDARFGRIEERLADTATRGEMNEVKAMIIGLHSLIARGMLALVVALIGLIPLVVHLY